MIGIGTEKVDLLTAYQYKYSSLLGLDNQSWGYSYRGLAQHNGRLKYYGKRYSSLCIVGVYVDLRRRFIEFYLNRRFGTMLDCMAFTSVKIVLCFVDHRELHTARLRSTRIRKCIPWSVRRRPSHR